ncbi:MAG: replication initiation protein [Spiroplasma ixodetis]|nr:replication initiation protein [Spiroplasma ixodetis]MBP1526954.1 replication initiation protein [Spiroplasma ixodetis]MBP1528114.1 replication initiation protein [Spiroplasma ixodetis]
MYSKLIKKIENKNIIIYYSNELARNQNQFTLEEEKVLHLIFSKIKPFEKNPTTFKIEKLDLFEKLNLFGNSKYERYKKIIQSLIGKTITKIEKMDSKSELIGTIICDSEWFYKEAFFEISLNSKFMPYIEELKNHYTKLDFNSVVKFKAKHSLTLYKMFCSWTDENKKTNQRYITTKELKELFNLSIDDYVYNGKFHRKLFEKYTIEKAINEINKITNINVIYKKNKKGNQVQNYEFTWIQKLKTHTDNYSKENTNKINSLNDKQTQMLLDNIDSN